MERSPKGSFERVGNHQIKPEWSNAVLWVSIPACPEPDAKCVHDINRKVITAEHRPVLRSTVHTSRFSLDHSFLVIATRRNPI